MRHPVPLSQPRPPATFPSHSADKFPFFGNHNGKQMKETKPSKLLSQAKWSWPASSYPLSHPRAAVSNGQMGTAKPIGTQHGEQGGAYPSSRGRDTGAGSGVGRGSRAEKLVTDARTGEKSE